jgi:hypothetical protein
MGRAVAGIILGYVVMSLFVIVTLTLAYLVLGTDGSFRPGSFEVTPLWVTVSFVLGLIAAICGGLACVWIARRPRPAWALAALVLVLGFVMALPALNAPEEPQILVRDGDVSCLDAMMQAQQPTWVSLATPVVGALGVLLGGRVRRRGGSGEA